MEYFPWRLRLLGRASAGVRGGGRAPEAAVGGGGRGARSLSSSRQQRPDLPNCTTFPILSVKPFVTLCYHDIIKRIRELSQHRGDISKPEGFLGNRKSNNSISLRKLFISFLKSDENK